MTNGAANLVSWIWLSNSWIWLTFIGLGLILVITELIIGVDTGLDLVFIGVALIVAGLVTWPFYSWKLSLLVTSILCALYLVLARRYVQRWKTSGTAKTNIDAIIGRTGIVLEDISRTGGGLVRVSNENWKASSTEDIKKGDEIIVIKVTGVTLDVKIIEKGGS